MFRGGPSTARTDWVGGFMDECAARGLPVDFVSTHQYATDHCWEGTEYEDAPREVKMNLPRRPHGMDWVWRQVERVRGEVDARQPGTPLIWSEWNSIVGWPWGERDACNNAAHVCGASAAFERWCDGQLFWNLSDIWEEPDLHFEPFSGQMGMCTVDGIPKASARAFELLHRLESGIARVEGAPEGAQRGCIPSISADGSRVTIVLWNQREREGGNDDWRVRVDMGERHIGRNHPEWFVQKDGKPFSPFADRGCEPPWAERCYLDPTRGLRPRLSALPKTVPLGIPLLQDRFSEQPIQVECGNGRPGARRGTAVS